MAPRRAAGALCLAAVCAFVALKYLGTVNHWKLTQWLFSYELGFVKRGLVGTLVSAASPGGVVRAETVVAVSLAVAAGLVAGFAALAWPLLRDLRRRRAAALALCALASPGVGFLLSDLGRFDALNYALLCGALLAARAAGRFPAPLFVALACGMLLVHEAALLLALPVLFVAHLDAEGRLADLAEPRRWPRLLARLAPVLVLGAALVTLGGVDLGLRELHARLAAGADFRPSPQSAYVLLRGLDSNLAQIAGRESAVALGGAPGPPLGPIQMRSFARILPFALAQLALAHALLGALAPARRRAVRLALHLAFLAPFPLLAIGVDWGRWAALGSAHVATLTLLFARELPEQDETPLARPAAVAAALFVILAAGASYEMEGARGGSAESPRAGVQRWMQDADGSDSWHRAFVTR